MIANTLPVRSGISFSVIAGFGGKKRVKSRERFGIVNFANTINDGRIQDPERCSMPIVFKFTTVEDARMTWNTTVGSDLRACWMLVKCSRYGYRGCRL